MAIVIVSRELIEVTLVSRVEAHSGLYQYITMAVETEVIALIEPS